MRISLNLATRPFADLGPAIKRLRIAMAVMAGLSILFGIGLHLVYHNAELARAREHSLDGSISRVTRERQQYTDMMHQTPNAALLQQVGLLNSLFDEKVFSWTLAMEDLENVLPGGVQVTSIEPVRAKDGQITLHLRVNGPRDREVALVQNLEHSRRFLSPRIVGEAADAGEGQNNQQLQPVSASNRFNFDLLAEYNPATMGEITSDERKAAAEKNEGAPPAHQQQPAGSTAAQQSGRMPYPGPRRPMPAGSGVRVRSGGPQ
jgi:type IV pilus assembly protein PilN